MASATKTARVLVASQSITANLNGTTWDLSVDFGGVVAARLVFGATVPSSACAHIVQISNDGTNWFDHVRQAVTPVINTTVSLPPIDLPASVLFARSRFEHPGGAAVTVEAQGHELTSIG